MRRSSSGISPVVATVILVAIAIVIAIAVAFWASGLVGIFTRFEKIEITAAYVDDEGNVVLEFKNTGSAQAVIDKVLINGRPYDIDDITLTVGQPGSLKLNPSNVNLIKTGGVTNEIALHSTSGKIYPVAVLVP